MRKAERIERALEVEAPQMRTPDAVRQDHQRRKPPQFPVEPQGSGQKRVKPFLPTMNPSEYLAHKQRPTVPPAYSFPGGRTAARASGRASAPQNRSQNPGTMTAAVAPAPAPAAAPAALSPVTVVGPDFDGASEVDGLVPPDTHGAVGSTQFVEVTNSHIDIFDKLDHANRTSISLAAFFGYFNRTLFDPRAVYDSVWNRWVITADAFPESPDVQFFFLAISVTSDATGPFFIYQLNVTFTSGDLWDFPQLGMDQDAVIITANIFDASGNFQGADMFAIAKAHLYNGLGFSVPVFTGLVGTLAPPLVLDDNPSTYLIAAQPIASALQLYTLQNSSRPAGTTLSGPVDVPVDSYTFPQQAVLQPGPGCDNLDAGDARFVNASTQVANFLWQVHSVDFFGAALVFYQIDTGQAAVVQSGFVFASGTSSDFNASIAANSDSDVFLNWTSVDAPNGVNAQVRFAGCDHNDGACLPGPGVADFTSPTCITGQFGRWGDYSAVTVDPSNPRVAWLVNEKIDTSTEWGSRIAAIGF
jgi:hypothetical protein